MNSRSHNRNSLSSASFLVAFACAAAMLLAIPALAAAACPNEAIRASQVSEALPQGTTSFPACMALEMVSPPKKFGQEVSEFNGFSANGARALFRSKAALGETEGLQSLGGDRYIGVLGTSGWSTVPTSPPRTALIAGGGDTAGGPFAFNPDLDGWMLFGNTQQQEKVALGQIFNGAPGGGFSSLSPVLNAIDDSGTASIQSYDGNLTFSGTSADLSATVFRPLFISTAYLPGDPRNESPENGPTFNSYVAFLDSAGTPTLQLLARDQAGTVYGGRCGSYLGGGIGLNQGAISPDGSRIFFSTRPAQPPSVGTAGPPCSTTNPLRIMVRSGDGPQIEELIPAGGPSAPGNDLFQGASVDGSKVFLTSPRKLASSDQDPSAEECSDAVGASKGCDLYLYDSSLPPAERLIQASAGEDVTGKHEVGKGADVLSSIAATSADGSHAYFAAQGVLTADQNPEGATAQAGKPNLYLYERDAANPSGRIAFLGTLAETDNGSLWGSAHSLTAGAYPVPLVDGGGDGHILFLLSRASLTANDTDGGHTDVFRYDSSGTATLQCISCAPGGPDSAPFDAEAGPVEETPSSNFAEQGRWASEDGETVAFATGEPLVPGDTDGEANPYLWKEGALAQLPGDVGQPSQPKLLPVTSLSGNEVGFLSTVKVLPQDGDTARDAYVARTDGGFPTPVAAPVCDPLSEAACQGPPSGPGSDRAYATESLTASGNQKAPAKCRKSRVRKRGKCVTRHQKKDKKTHKRASHKRGGSK